MWCKACLGFSGGLISQARRLLSSRVRIMRSFLKKIPGSTVGLLWSNVGSLIGRSSCYLARGVIVNFGGKGGLVCNSLSGRS